MRTKTPRKLSLKQNGFVADTIITKNPTEAIVRNYNVKDRIVAKSMASENLAKPYIQEEINKKLEDSGLSIEHLTQIHRRNLDQSKQLGVSQSAVETGYKLHGLLRDKEDKGNTNIAIVIEK